MAASFTIYNKFKQNQLNGGAIDLDTDTIKLALTTSSYTPNIDTHDFFDDITNEVTGTGYSAGGATLTTPVVSLDTANDRVTFDADDVSWASSTITNARYGILYKSTGVASTSRLIGYIDFGSNFSTSGSTFTVPWNAVGIFRLT